MMFGESDEALHIRGNEQLPLAIAREIGFDNIQLTRRLSALQKLHSGAYRLTFTLISGQKETVEADKVVLAIPFAVLREIDILDAGFDERKLRAIRELGRGLNAKTHLQFHSRFWNKKGAWPGVSSGSSYSDTGYQSGWEITRAQAGTQGVLSFYSGGSHTLALKAAQSKQPFTTNGHALALQDAEATLKAGEPVFPGLKDQWNGRYTQSIPHLSPLIRASYAYYRVGQYTDFGGYEGVKQGGVFFCGEHTSPDFQGFMEGGAAEGIRAAKEVLQA
jgi:monoamine oxidase